MLKEERHSLILKSVQEQQKVLTIELSEALQVSEDTIRRDLKELSDLGQLKKVHGGAVSKRLNPFHYRDRVVYALEQKQKIALKAVKLIKDQAVLLIDGGTSNLELVRALPRNLSAKIFTNSIPIATELAEHPHVEVIFAGGKVLKNAQATVGSEVVNLFSGLHADLCFLGMRGLHHQIGITEIDWEETQVKRVMINAAAKVVSLIIPEKIEIINPYVIGTCEQLHTIVSSLDPQNYRLDLYRNMGIEII